jgi:hypothetical protein
MATLSSLVQPNNILTASNTKTVTNKTITYADNTLTGVAGVTATQTLTNKTLTTPVITGTKETKVAIAASEIDLALATTSPRRSLVLRLLR